MGLKKKENEKRKKPKAGIPILAGKSALTDAMSVGAARVGARGALASFGANLGANMRAVFGSDAAMIATLTLAFTISAIGLNDMRNRWMANEPVLGFSASGPFPAAPDRGGPIIDKPKGSGLGLLAAANSGAFGDDSAATGDEEVIDGEAEPEEVEGEALADENALEKALGDAASGGDEDGDKENKTALGNLKLAAGLAGAQSLGGGGQGAGSVGQMAGRGASLSGDDPLGRETGRSKSFTKSRKMSTRGKGAGGRTNVKGAHNRLKRMNRAMGSARKMEPAMTAGVHNKEWTAADAGQSIGGAGTSVGAPGVSGSGAPGAGLQNGGLVGGGSGGGDSGAIEDAEEVEDVGPSENVTPWQDEMDFAMFLLPLAGLLLMMSTRLAQAGHHTIAKVLGWMAAAVSAVVTALGVMIMSKGQMLHGGAIAATGGIMFIMSVMAAMGAEQTAEQEEIDELISGTEDEVNANLESKDILNESAGGIDSSGSTGGIDSSDVDSNTLV